jgi:hypothetical protein
MIAKYSFSKLLHPSNLELRTPAQAQVFYIEKKVKTFAAMEMA